MFKMGAMLLDFALAGDGVAGACADGFAELPRLRLPMPPHAATTAKFASSPPGRSMLMLGFSDII